MLQLDLDLAYQWIAVLFGIGQVVAAFELLSLRREFARDGLFPWRILRFEHERHLRSARLARVFEAVFGEKGITVLLVLRAFAGAALIASARGGVVFTLAAACALVSILALHFRQTYGADGSDQMGLITAVCLLFGHGALATDLTALACAVFLAAQGCLSYAVAGVAKLASREWRGGVAVFEVVNTYSYGAPTIARLLLPHPALGALLTWSVVAFEVTFPLAVVGPAPLTVGFLAAGVLFHIANAAVMGLNSFVWAFLATYPAILHVAGRF